MKINVAIILVSVGLWVGPAFGSADIPKNPAELILKYEDGVTLKISRDKLKGLTEVSLNWGGGAVKVPAGDFAEISNPELEKISFFETRGLDGEKIAIVKIEYDRRPYPWGKDSSAVSFHFTDRKYSSRELSIPAGKDQRTLVR